MSKFCPKCGCENLDEASFCLECGAALPSIEEVQIRSSRGDGTSHQSSFSSNLNDDEGFNQETTSFSQSSSNQYDSNEASNSSKIKNVINDANPANNDNKSNALCCLVIFVILLIAFICHF